MSVTAVLHSPSRTEAASSIYHLLLAPDVISLSIYTPPEKVPKLTQPRYVSEDVLVVMRSC